MIKDSVTGENTPLPICPISIYFEGDEDKCDTSKCDFDTGSRGCSEGCKIDSNVVGRDCSRCRWNVSGKTSCGKRESKSTDKIINCEWFEEKQKDTEEQLLNDDKSLLPGSGVSWHQFKEPDYRILRTFDNPNRKVDFTITFSTNELTSLCPLTGFADFYTLEINYTPALKCIESKSAKFYFHSFRSYGAFIETLANRIADDWQKICSPKYLKVDLTMAARGGIPINVVVERTPFDERKIE